MFTRALARSEGRRSLQGMGAAAASRSRTARDGSVYVNFMPEGDEHRVAEAYGPNYGRLARIKKQVDPTNLFRGNQNIGPGASRPV
jgi:FAD/FMN-containing dehydrogenase